ncbi:putative zinc phosphodiesterase [Fasciolopsis buskii]|uniref:Putative zinc phosphodiesterase n=1 Tax=Fasciolopsis buskii TaxID=27845 RepID=A0A8E0VL40_9TREM|nr:putative zinc phosphodiesterase [Fasciolopsis buski]
MLGSKKEKFASIFRRFDCIPWHYYVQIGRVDTKWCYTIRRKARVVRRVQGLSTASGANIQQTDTGKDHSSNSLSGGRRKGDLIFLGTASGYPSPHRGASGLILRNTNDGDHWLFDCGEGTQIQAQKSPNVRLGRISRIFISHLHGDHMFGLPGLLCTIDQKGAAGDLELPAQTESHPHTAAVNIYGPKGLRRSRLNYTYAVHELVLRAEHKPNGWEDWASLEADSSKDPPLYCEIPGRDFEAHRDGFWYNVLDRDDGDGAVIHAMALRHTIPSLGWLILRPERERTLDVHAARSLGIPDGPLMGQIKRGLTVVINEKTINPDQVLLPPVRGHRIAIMGDSYDSSSLKCLVQSLFEQGKLSSVQLDVLVHETTFQNSMASEAVEKGHSTPDRVAELSLDLDVQLLILTHFSHRYSPIESGENDTGGDSNPGSKHKDKPSLQILLDEVKSTKFRGQVVLADDLALIRVPPVSK